MLQQPHGSVDDETPLRVLVVDDDETSRSGLARLVRSFGHVVMEASDGSEALTLFERDGADVILSDWAMPNMSGLELCRRVRTGASTKGLPYFVFVTGLADRDHALAALHSGADHLLEKPLDAEMLEATLVAAHRLAVAQGSLRAANTALRRESQRAFAAARVDALTQAANRRQLDEDLLVRCASVALQKRPAALALMDVDFFKAYNDSYGHVAGDNALRELVRSMQATLRRGDRLYRYGGEEFAVLLDDIAPPAARRATLRMQEAVRKLALPHPASATGVVSISVGLACGPETSPEAWLSRADKALYEAKALGRDALVVDDG